MLIKRIMAGLLLVSFLAAPALADYIEGRAAASQLLDSRKYQEAIEAFVNLAEGDYNDFQKADALERAAYCARQMKEYERADELADQIPLEPVAKSVKMQNLAHQREYEALVEQYKDEPLDTWPAYAAVDAYHVRGQAHAQVGNGEAAEADLSEAAKLYPDELDRAAVLYQLGKNREGNLDDQEGALEAYMRAVAMERINGNSRYFNNVLAASQLLRERGDYEQAETVLRNVRGGDLANLPAGYWQSRFYLELATIHEAAGNTQEAIAAYEAVLANDKSHPGHQKTAKEAVARLGGAAE